jgi:hypothetical protein
VTKETIALLARHGNGRPASELIVGRWASIVTAHEAAESANNGVFSKIRFVQLSLLNPASGF